MSASMLLQLLVSGLCNSFILLLASLGLVIILGYMKVVNLAHTEMLMVGAYICYYTYKVAGLPFILCLLIAFAVSFLFGMLVERTVIRHFYGKASETLLATYAISILLKQLALLLFGRDYKQVDYPITSGFSIGPVYVEGYKLALIGIAALALLCTLLFINRTKLGRMIRATTQNRTMTECLGIDTRKVDTITFAYGMGLAGLAGAAIAPLSAVTYSLGRKLADQHVYERRHGRGHVACGHAGFLGHHSGEHLDPQRLFRQRNRPDRRACVRGGHRAPAAAGADLLPGKKVSRCLAI